MDIGPGLLVSIITIVAGITIFSFLRSRHIERMLQLQKGISLDKENMRYLEIKFGLLFLGIGTGSILALVLNRIYLLELDHLQPSLIFLFGGLGLFASFFLIERIEENKNS